MKDDPNPEAPMSTGEAARVYGFGEGESSRRAFVRYVEERERRSGRKIFGYRGKNRCITDSVVRRRLPELSKKKLSLIEQKIRRGLSEIDRNLADRIDQRIDEHPVIVALQEQHDSVTEILQQVVSAIRSMRPTDTN